MARGCIVVRSGLDRFACQVAQKACPLADGDVFQRFDQLGVAVPHK